jgi:hypothetical protein
MIGAMVENSNRDQGDCNGYVIDVMTSRTAWRHPTRRSRPQLQAGYWHQYCVANQGDDCDWEDKIHLLAAVEKFKKASATASCFVAWYPSNINPTLATPLPGSGKALKSVVAWHCRWFYFHCSLALRLRGNFAFWTSAVAWRCRWFYFHCSLVLQLLGNFAFWSSAVARLQLAPYFSPDSGFSCILAMANSSLRL